MKAAESCSFFLSISAIDETKEKILVYRNLSLVGNFAHCSIVFMIAVDGKV